MKILVIGATRGTGRCVVEKALARGHEVTALVRDGAKLGPLPGLRIAEGDVLDPDAVERAVRGQDAVVSALGTLDRKSKVRSAGVANAIAAMKRHGVRRLAVVSAIGVGDSRDQARRSSFVFGRIILPLFLEEPFADMLAMEDAVRASGLSWTIVRPTGLTDGAEGGAVKVTLDGARVGARISRRDVAAFLVDAVETDAHVGAAPSVHAA